MPLPEKKINLIKLINLRNFKNLNIRIIRTIRAIRIIPSITLLLSGLFILQILFGIALPSAHAQGTDFEIVSTYAIEDENAQIGDIVARNFEEGTIKLAEKNLSEAIIGVIADNPPVVYRTGENESPVARSGIFPVNVTTIGGEIEPGDFITSSKIPGKGVMTETLTEAVLGQAVEGFNGENGTEIEFEGETYQQGQIKVDLNVKPVGQGLGSFGDILSLAKTFGIPILQQLQTDEGSSVFFRYMLAAMITIISVYIAFRHFGSSILGGIEAIGRNPLARRNIQAAILINAVVLVLVSVSVVVLSLLIIKL